MADQNDVASGRNWVAIGGLLSAGYLAILALVAWPLTHFGMLAFSQAISVNELGDALAGIFAPLAFLWLFVATMVQSQELALQRKELVLQRKELAQSRDVFTEQATEAKRSADFIATQTEVMKKQADRVDQQTKVMLLNAKVETYAKFLDRLGTGPSILSPVSGGASHLPMRGEPLTHVQHLIDTTARHRRWLSEIGPTSKHGNTVSVSGLASSVRDEWVERLEDILSFKDETTPEARHFLEEAKVAELVSTLKALHL